MGEQYWKPEIMNGAIPICHLGCALRQWLVVNGEQKGFVWNDSRVDNGGISPVRNTSGSQTTFSDWYMSWLEESLRKVEVMNRILDFLDRGDKVGAAKAYREEHGCDQALAERAVGVLATRHRIGKPRSRRRDLLVALVLIVAGVALAALIGLLRK